MTWGFMWFGGKPFGGMPPHWDTLQDVLEASQQVIMWSNDVLATQVAFNSGVAAATYLQWVKAQGKPMIFIDPVCNYTAGIFADKWIPINLGTDSALCLAIANTWIQENTYNSNYIASHTYGFDAWKAYVLGTEDGVPKTPAWAEPITGVKAPLIRALV